MHNSSELYTPNPLRMDHWAISKTNWNEWLWGKEWWWSVENWDRGRMTCKIARCLKASRARAHNLLNHVLWGALESQRTLGDCREAMKTKEDNRFSAANFTLTTPQQTQTWDIRSGAWCWHCNSNASTPHPHITITLSAADYLFKIKRALNTSSKKYAHCNVIPTGWCRLTPYQIWFAGICLRHKTL